MTIVKDFNLLPESVKKKLRSLSFKDRNLFLTAISEGRLKMDLITGKIKRKMRRRVRRKK